MCGKCLLYCTTLFFLPVQLVLSLTPVALFFLLYLSALKLVSFSGTVIAGQAFPRCPNKDRLAKILWLDWIFPVFNRWTCFLFPSSLLTTYRPRFFLTVILSRWSSWLLELIIAVWLFNSIDTSIMANYRPRFSFLMTVFEFRWYFSILTQPQRLNVYVY